ncbi:2,3-diaminopropionate biosynthesis protein SbnB [Streptomyces sp. NPDC016566]|uniref:2,3-diaminopropionate biosynthesis protein SbnB n=1 Tax=Streptomyces sp. NPDC016566 TaxID=3364967 RepID=UPI0036FA33EA
MREFSVLPGKDVAELLAGREAEVIDWVREAYLAHDAGDTVNPDSHFLRFPEKPDARIIALPAYLGGTAEVAGIKWIGSFPGNITDGMPRASAVLVLNDYGTGYPLALLECASISAARTAASAALAVTALGATAPACVGVVGAGVIARTICHYLTVAGVSFADMTVHDLDDASAAAWARHITRVHDIPCRTGTLRQALGCDLVVLATTALSPYIGADHALRAGQVVLNVSLRDLEPELLLSAQNFVDDVEHCLKAGTSPHLAEQRVGHRSFIAGTLADVLLGRCAPDPERAVVFSPFGLGVLDLAVGHRLYQRAEAEGRLRPVPGFFGETSRW